MTTNEIPAVKRPWRPAPDRDVRLESIRRAVQGVLALEGVRVSHKRALLNVLIWNLTGIDGDKWGIRYRSEGVLSDNVETIQHEHVLERKKLIDRLLADPTDYESILRGAVACLVTADEHACLRRVDRSLEGWDRYRAAGIIVYDMATSSRVPLEAEFDSQASQGSHVAKADPPPA